MFDNGGCESIFVFRFSPLSRDYTLSRIFIVLLLRVLVNVILRYKVEIHVLFM